MTSTNQKTQYIIAPKTDAKPVTPTIPANATGTVGHTGTVEYSKSRVGVIKERYVLADKK